MEYELYHHGIKGQKWGVRRYQDENGRLTAKGKERYHNTKSGMSKYAGMRPDGLDDFDVDRLVEVYATRKPNGKYKVVAPVDPEVMKNRFRQEYLDDPDSVFDKHMSKTNQSIDEENGTSNNCTKVASSMIMARMGYDYDAGRCNNNGSGKAFEYWFDGAEKTLSDNLTSAIREKFAPTANGSFGTVDFRSIFGGGHVLNWQKTSKGDFELYEGQCKNGEKYSGSSPEECFSKYTKEYRALDANATVRIYDMTNAKPNLGHMAEDSVLRITDDPSSSSMLFDKKTNQLHDGF